MYDSQGKIRKIVCITAGIWLISLLIFVLLCGKLIEKPPLVWISACTGYGIWNLCIFGCGYWAVRRTINRTMNGINACIQHLIDGQKKQFFGMEEESSLGKFQNQIWKLYEIINGAKEREEKMRREMSGLIADLVHQINTPLTNSRCTAGFWKETHVPRENGRRSAGSLTARLRNWGGSETDLQRRSGWRKM